MGCGFPVIGSRSRAIPEVIGECGIIFLGRHVEEIVHSATRPYESGERRQELAECGRDRALRYLNGRVIAERNLAVYKQLLSNGSG